ncbi:hypothetical protein [Herbaspirillum huttiense]|uniref:hypothetical protein n=1 Tax=Herbaspirillum huttiense TaxID=863372 RepID=UPI0039AF698B
MEHANGYPVLLEYLGRYKSNDEAVAAIKALVAEVTDLRAAAVNAAAMTALESHAQQVGQPINVVPSHASHGTGYDVFVGSQRLASATALSEAIREAATSINADTSVLPQAS